MALFGNKKEEKKDKKPVAKKDTEKKSAPAKKEVVAKEKVSTPASTSNRRDVSWVLRKPRITEKSAISAEKKVYVFEVDSRATKKDVSQAIVESYKVTPKKINIAKVPSKKVTRRKRTGATSGYKAGKKKAYIFLDKKDSIEFV